MPRKPKKHPREMTNEETIRHLFHPKIVEHVKGVVEKHDLGKPSERSQVVDKDATK
jgi:hypothetical protein